MDRFAQAAGDILNDITLFSEAVIGLPLHDYQLKPLHAIVDSTLSGQGREFLLVFPRQSGKNEAVAQLLVFLLNLLQRAGGNIVFGATGDGLGRGIDRLEQRLENPLNEGQWEKASSPTRRRLANAVAVFLSTHPQAAARGETAHWLLVVDEFQDQLSSHIEAVFEPMRAANNASALYIGTVKTTNDGLWQKKLELEKEQQEDGLQRVFVVAPETVSAANPAYGRFVDEKVRRHGRHHPIVASEYFNEPIDGQGGLFDERRLALMRGSHQRQRAPGETQGRPKWMAAAPLYVASLDVAGQDEAATDPLARLANPGRDYTVAHIFQLIPGQEDEPGPTYLARDVFVDQGSRHFQDVPGRPKLVERLLAWLRRWEVAHLVADESGVGGGVVDWLAAKMGSERVTGHNFASGHGKAALGNAFISLVETGRFAYWSGDRAQPLSDGWWFFQQAAACTYYLPPEGRFERDLRWGVPAGATADTPMGRQPIHDDRLISAALVAVYDPLYREGRLELGQAASAIVRPADPLDNLRF